MELVLRRSQKTVGFVAKEVAFVLYAQVKLTAEERYAVDEYKLGKLLVYTSESGRESIAMSREAAVDNRWILGIAALAKSALSLRLTIDNLTEGKTVEVKSLDEVLAAEAAIRQACISCKNYIATAQTFDGKEEVIEIA